jgi:hypothetical protein
LAVAWRSDRLDSRARCAAWSRSKRSRPAASASDAAPASAWYNLSDNVFVRANVAPRGVVAVPAGPPRRQHPRHSVQRIDRDPGIIGQRGNPSGGESVPGLGHGVLLERRAGLGRLVIGRHIVECQEFQAGDASPLEHPV